MRLKAIYIDWNQKINVISRKDMDEFYTRHVLHSLGIAKILQFEPGTKLLDVGTGGGFPAVPLSILFPKVTIVAVDSIAKKIKVVNAAKEELGLKNLMAYQARAEEVEGTFDFVVSRAVTRANRFLPWIKNKIDKKSKHELKNGCLMLKGGELEEELEETGRAYSIYQLADYFDAPFFETKKVVHIPIV